MVLVLAITVLDGVDQLEVAGETRQLFDRRLAVGGLETELAHGGDLVVDVEVPLHHLGQGALHPEVTVRGGLGEVLAKSLLTSATLVSPLAEALLLEVALLLLVLS
eukprot:4980778-Heterocapsa_arctica.AAC.1